MSGDVTQPSGPQEPSELDRVLQHESFRDFDAPDDVQDVSALVVHLEKTGQWNPARLEALRKCSEVSTLALADDASLLDALNRIDLEDWSQLVYLEL